MEAPFDRKTNKYMKYWHWAIKRTSRLFFMGLFLALLLCFGTVNAQHFTFVGKQKKESLTFKLVKGLIIIPITINGKGPYNFVLDTGVGSLIITDPALLDSLKLQDLRATKIYGLGQGKEIEAYLSNQINVGIKNAKMDSMPTAILKEDVFDLSNYLGTKIYGLIGYYFFNSFVVKINYLNSRLNYVLPTASTSKKGTKFPIVIENNRPYIFADLKTPLNQKAKVKLIVDCGASHGLSMDGLNGEPFPLPKETISANLGVGLSGIINGSIGRIPELSLGSFSFKNMLSSFPDFENSAAKLGYNQQDGNLGAELLRRFNVTYDYPNKAIYLKPNQKLTEPFEHDMSGIEVYSDPKYVNRLFIGRIEPGSPAEKAGFMEQDELITINLRPVGEYTLEDIGNLLKSQDGRTLFIEIIRKDKNIIKLLKLKKRV